MKVHAIERVQEIHPSLRRLNSGHMAQLTMTAHRLFKLQADAWDKKKTKAKDRGPWSNPEAVSDRLVALAARLAGETANIDMMKAAIASGFSQAQMESGGVLPYICHETKLLTFRKLYGKMSRINISV